MHRAVCIREYICYGIKLASVIVGECRFTFVVMPDGFVIHQPHEQSRSHFAFHTNKVNRNCLIDSKHDFQNYLIQKYGTPASKYASAVTEAIKLLAIKSSVDSQL